MKTLTGFISAAALVFTVACAQTDAGISSAVKSKLAADDTVKAYQVDVDTSNHVVTLKGDVNSPMAKSRAVEIARATDGVTDVIDQIRVTETAATTGRDDDDDVNIRVEDDRDDVNIRVDDDVEASADRAGAKAKSGAEKAADATVDTAKKVGDKAVEGTKKAGEKVKDVFTDNDPDSDKDGK